MRGEGIEMGEKGYPEKTHIRTHPSMETDRRMI
jgi:hypothetical protein